MKSTKPKYEVRVGKAWLPCKKAVSTFSGFLNYELKDGTTGLARAPKWRRAGVSK